VFPNKFLAGALDCVKGVDAWNKDPEAPVGCGVLKLAAPKGELSAGLPNKPAVGV
jgi:hypothetical protein